MRYKNGGPVKLYVLICLKTGRILFADTNKAVARYRRDAQHGKVVLLTYDQRVDAMR